MFHLNPLKAQIVQRENSSEPSNTKELAQIRQIDPKRDLQTQRSQLLTQLKEDIVADLAFVLEKQKTSEQIVPQPPQQIIINNVAASSVPKENRKKSSSSVLEHFREFMQSPLNRVAVFGLTGAGVWLLWGYLEHKWHMEAVQKKIDANLLLRASQWAFNPAADVAKTAASDKKLFNLF